MAAQGGHGRIKPPCRTERFSRDGPDSTTFKTLELIKLIIICMQLCFFYGAQNLSSLILSSMDWLDPVLEESKDGDNIGWGLPNQHWCHYIATPTATPLVAIFGCNTLGSSEVCFPLFLTILRPALALGQPATKMHTSDVGWVVQQLLTAA